MNTNKLLSRKDFRESVFERDHDTCVVCNEPAVDAHHLMERGLWSDEGYYLDNGASLCEHDHRLAERNIISPQALRQILRIKTPILPKQLDPTVDYNKWGEPFRMPTRIDIKYPSTSYFDFSPSKTNIRETEDIDISHLVNVPLIVTVKMDGSNAKLTKDYVAARNGRQANHRSFDMLKQIHSKIKYKIGDVINKDIIIFGEWLYSKHSIHYVNDLSLDDLFQVFGMYNTKTRMWLGWDAVVFETLALDFCTVPVVTHLEETKEWELTNKICELAEEQISKGHEGIVVRSALPIHYGQFGQLVGKYVRANHVQTDDHWMNQKTIRNRIKEDEK